MDSQECEMQENLNASRDENRCSGVTVVETINGSEPNNYQSTRGVSALSTAQRDSKRAKDRASQRAIRQRTRDRIEQLEKRVAELSTRVDNDADKIMNLRKENRELSEENTFLKMKTQHVNLCPLASLPHEETRWDDLSTTNHISSHETFLSSQSLHNYPGNDVFELQTPYQQKGDPSGASIQHSRRCDATTSLQQDECQTLASEQWKAQYRISAYRSGNAVDHPFEVRRGA